MKRMTIAVSVLAAAGLSFNAAAQDTGFYVGAGLGLADLDEDAADFQTTLTDAGATGTADVDDDGLGWKLFGGYRFSQYFGAELAWIDLGTADLDYAVTLPTAVSGVAKASVDGFTANAVASYPIADRVSVFGKAGLFAWDAKVDAVVPDIGDLSGNDDGVDLMFGLGGRLAINERVAVRAEWERMLNVSADKNDPDLFSLGLEVKF